MLLSMIWRIALPISDGSVLARVFVSEAMLGTTYKSYFLAALVMKF